MYVCVRVYIGIYTNYPTAGSLRINDLASAVLDVLDNQARRLVQDTELVRAARLVALLEVERADLVVAVLALGVDDVDELVVARHPRAGLLQAADDKVDAVGRAQGQLAVVQQAVALAVVDVLPLDVDAAARVRVLRRGLAEDELVPGVVRDVVRAAGAVDLEHVEAAALVAQLHADVVAVDVAGPVGHAVGVDQPAQHAHRRRVLVVGGDGDGACSGEDRGRDGGGRRGEEAEGVAEGRHFDELDLFR